LAIHYFQTQRKHGCDVLTGCSAVFSDCGDHADLPRLGIRHPQAILSLPCRDVPGAIAEFQALSILRVFRIRCERQSLRITRDPRIEILIHKSLQTYTVARAGVRTATRLRCINGNDAAEQNYEYEKR
jgi:hypothetical protein